jgi:hypothetical protein
LATDVRAISNLEEMGGYYIDLQLPSAH